MKTIEQAPWVEYLIIKKNGERKLKLFTPLKIRKAYKNHLKENKKNIDQNTPISK
jgi:hypothetical protein